MATIMSKTTAGIAGVITEEILDENGYRIGFRARNEKGENEMIAHSVMIKSDTKVAKYYIDLEALEIFYSEQFDRFNLLQNIVIVIDEIGRMQAKSPKVLELIDNLLNNKQTNMIASIVYDEEDWAKKFKENPNILLLELTTQNRDELTNALIEFCNANKGIRMLEEVFMVRYEQLLSRYFENYHFVSIHKLLNNALEYLLNKSYKKINTSNKSVNYSVNGKSRQHNTNYDKLSKTFSCDCDLFLRFGEFTGINQECSHVQVVRILEGLT